MTISMKSTSPQPSIARLDSLTGLRWWAAFAVFFFHLRNLMPMPGILGPIAQYGYLGVTFFFVLSGFVLTWSWRPSVGIGTFYWRRIARIFPLHLTALALAIPVFYSLTPDPAHPWENPFDGGVLLLNVFLLQGWSRDLNVLFSGNPAAWTLTAELFFYALHPFIMKPLRRLQARGALWVALGVLLISVLVRVAIIAAPTGWLAGLPWPVLRLNEFVIGMSLAWAIRSGWRPRFRAWLPVGGMVLYLGTLSLLERIPDSQGAHDLLASGTSETMTVLFALLICAFAANDIAGRSRLMRARPLLALGEWSYAFYLVHATLIYAARDLVGYQTFGKKGIAISLLVLAASIALSWLLHIGIERPAERRLRAMQNGWAAAITARRAGQRTGAASS
ncbi:acyltransferase family protein [Microbacterium sp. NPDC057659]|uniref:acyltransferase family protein n=1 Tax=Microbacterium sp. NPDC057659 TaxID=3346198 RepID=UPI00366AFC34